MLVIEGYILKYGVCHPIWWESKYPAFMKDEEGNTIEMRRDIPVYIGDYDKIFDGPEAGKAKVFLRPDGIWAKIILPAHLYSIDMFVNAKLGCILKDIVWNDLQNEAIDGEIFAINIQVGENSTNIHPVQKITEDRPFREAIYWTSEYYNSLSEEEDNNGR